MESIIKTAVGPMCFVSAELNIALVRWFVPRSHVQDPDQVMPGGKFEFAALRHVPERHFCILFST
jgi:hypothetical protein